MSISTSYCYITDSSETQGLKQQLQSIRSVCVCVCVRGEGLAALSWSWSGWRGSSHLSLVLFGPVA